MTDRQWWGEDIAVETTEVDGLPVTRVTGEVDALGVDLLREELDDQLDRRPRMLVADLTGVTVLGSLGIGLLLDAHRRAAADGVEFAVVAAQRAVVRPLRLTEVDRVLTVRPTLADVLAPAAG
ncbi:anti-sigma factor antagonist [Saccharothrix hoggarensis]|uniref:Anti-sigma factor antagonist n=1 Tax=Saccharothrix hoggarensis TaxID=913853 RepID=A0ABW3R1F8_9PSEU